MSVGKVAGPALERRGRAAAGLIAEWAAIVGADLAAHSLPEEIVFPRGSKSEGVLRLRVGGPRAVEIQHLAPQIIERINGYFGYRAVARLAFVQAPIEGRAQRAPREERAPTPGEERAIERALSGIADPDLKVALARLGRALVGRACEP
ncbi:MAG: DUF721 domain-containing protein [Proteobacteria bacterium]|nr:DUF721 domain-containing protein [Pseudomonadota bacterium]